MPRISSPNSDFNRIEPLSSEDAYRHPAESRKGAIPMAFQVTSPFNRRTLLLPHALVLHVNPSSFEESNTQKIERIQTRGGFVEQHWGSQLTEISASASTGAFMNIYTGLTSVLRQQTIAWDKYRDLLDLYLNNGSVYDPTGNIVLQGSILLMYDRGNYLGTFRTFEMEETDDSPFAFKLSWTFKVEATLLAVTPQTGRQVAAPKFQSRNRLRGSAADQGEAVFAGRQAARQDQAADREREEQGDG